MMHWMYLIHLITLHFIFNPSISVDIPGKDLVDLQDALDKKFDPCEHGTCDKSQKLLPFASAVIRLIFSDCGGYPEGQTTGSKCDGCVASNEFFHKGLSTRAIAPLETLYTDKYKTRMSRADFWAFAATQAIKYVVHKTTDTDLPELKWYFGRKDCSTSPNFNGINAKTFPSVVGDWLQTYNFMNTNFNLNVEETVAILGAHTFGRKYPQDLGFDKPWTKGMQQRKFDNQYYENIINDEFTKGTISGTDGNSYIQWQCPGKTMLNPDLSLYYDLSTCTDSGKAEKQICSPNIAANGYVTKFANDNNAFLAKFVSAYTKMVKIGYSSLTEVGDNQIRKGYTISVGGDPHFVTWDNSRHHMQGVPATPGKNQYYYITSCDVSNKRAVPFNMLATHHPWGRVSGLKYVTLVLYDNDDKYYVFLSVSIKKYVKVTDGVSTVYDKNNGIALTQITSGRATNIGNRFVIVVKQYNGNHIDVTLTMDGKCQLKFTMHSWYLRVMPPNCYRRYICGVLGDFKPDGFRSQQLIKCNGQPMQVVGDWGSAIRDGTIFGSNGFSWEKTYVDENCGGSDGEYEFDAAKAPVNGNQVIDECDESIKDEVIATCQQVRDEQKACCKKLGGDFCDSMQANCEVDACILSEGDSNAIASNVYNFFTEQVVEECKDCPGCFGPIPKLLYEFDGNLKETQSKGDDKYTLQAAGDAKVANGVLNCDGSGDYAYSQNDLDFNMKSHSLEVLVSLDDLDKIGGGAISIDSKYTSNGGYQHNQFDSIVYNELGDRRWFSGSEGLQRTQQGVGTQEDKVQEYIHLVTTYDIKSNLVRLYRNGVKEQGYTPSGFLEVDKKGYRIMFCQRHMDANGDDYRGRIKFGAIYDYALCEEEVEILYANAVANVFGVQYEVIGDDLLPDKTLQTGQALRSTNLRYVAVLQRDGNFVVYDLSKATASDAASFATKTADAQSDETRYITYQSSDGKVVLYRNTPYSGAKYTANKGSDGTGFLIMENDGRLVVYDSKGDVKWSSSNLNPIYNQPSPVNPYLINYIGFIILVLIMVNIICIAIYYKNNKRTKRKYKVISMESTDFETDTEEVEN